MDALRKFSADFQKLTGIKLRKDFKSYRGRISDTCSVSVNLKILNRYYPSAEITVLPPNVGPDSMSGKYNTYLLTFRNPFISSSGHMTQSGFKFHIVHTLGSKEQGTIKSKILSPIELINESIMDDSHAVDIIKQKLHKTDVRRNVRALCELLLDEVMKTENTESVLKSFEDELKFSSDAVRGLFNTLNEKDISIISQDFGEILCALWAKRKFGFFRLLFPRISNSALTDFTLDDIHFSVKYDQGAAPSLKTAAEFSRTVNSEKFSDIKKILNIIDSNSLISGTFLLTEFLKLPIMKNIKKLVPDISFLNFETKLNSLADKIFRKRTADSTYRFFCDNVYEKSKASERSFTVLKDKKDRLGLFLSPMSYDCAYALNMNEKRIQSFNELMNMMSVWQIRIKKLNEQGMKVSLNSFSNMRFRFEGAGTAVDYKLGKLKFKAVSGKI